MTYRKNEGFKEATIDYFDKGDRIIINGYNYIHCGYKVNEKGKEIHYACEDLGDGEFGPVRSFPARKKVYF